MKLLTGGKDISQLIEKITWSGDTSQVSRKINFTVPDFFPGVVHQETEKVCGYFHLLVSGAETDDNIPTAFHLRDGKKADFWG